MFYMSLNLIQIAQPEDKFELEVLLRSFFTCLVNVIESDGQMALPMSLKLC